MITNIVAQVVEIWVSRDFDEYTHSIYQDSVLKAARKISQARAAEIINENPDGRVRGFLPVDWTPGAKQFTWIARIQETAV